MLKKYNFFRFYKLQQEIYQKLLNKRDIINEFYEEKYVIIIRIRKREIISKS